MLGEQENNKEHISYINIINEIVGKNWGKEWCSLEDAEKDMLQDGQLAGYALLAILKKISTMENFVFEFVGNMLWEKREKLHEKTMRKWLSDRECKHGPCPESVKRWLYDQIWSLIGSCSYPSRMYVYPWSLPEKGTKSRKEYDNWMRRKKRD